MSTNAAKLNAEVPASETFRLLHQEGYLFRSALTTGLSALCKANSTDPGTDKVYTAFFQLSIGLERLTKTILIVTHMSKNRMNPPQPQFIKSLGHNLVKLIEL